MCVFEHTHLPPFPFGRSKNRSKLHTQQASFEPLSLNCKTTQKCGSMSEKWRKYWQMKAGITLVITFATIFGAYYHTISEHKKSWLDSFQTECPNLSRDVEKCGKDSCRNKILHSYLLIDQSCPSL